MTRVLLLCALRSATFLPYVPLRSLSAHSISKEQARAEGALVLRQQFNLKKTPICIYTIRAGWCAVAAVKFWAAASPSVPHIYKLPCCRKTPPPCKWRIFLRNTIDGKHLTENAWRKTLDGKHLKENTWRKTLDGKHLKENTWRKTLDGKTLYCICTMP